MDFNSFNSLIFTNLVNTLIRPITVVSEWWDTTEMFSEFMLVNIKGCGVTSDVRYFSGLKGSNLLFNSDGNLLGVLPLLR